MTLFVTVSLVVILVGVVITALLVSRKRPKRDIQDEVKQAVNSAKDADPVPSMTVGPPTIGGTRIYSAEKEQTIRFNCPSCGQHFDAPRGMVGDNIKCPACSKEFVVPAPGTSSDTEE